MLLQVFVRRLEQPLERCALMRPGPIAFHHHHLDVISVLWQRCRNDDATLLIVKLVTCPNVPLRSGAFAILNFKRAR